MLQQILGSLAQSEPSITDWIGLILWVLTVGFSIATVVIYGRQLKVMREAQASTEKSLREQNLAWLIQYLQSSDVRESREYVLTTLADWISKRGPMPGDDKSWLQAATACAAYGVAGIYIKTGRVDAGVILEHWGPSIDQVVSVCKPMIDHRRRQLGDNYWASLVELHEMVISAGKGAKRRGRDTKQANQ